ncbi:MAG: ATP-binding cassette domain-containing protein [Peptococcaceae bacterium]|nr:ATP-binding cassette domain-containing protein [Peptococcaceae bacterium]
MLTLSNLTKTFSKGTAHSHKALDGLNLKVNDGDFITVVGSNGAGKSTMFNAICGDFFLDRGHIKLGDKDITYLPGHKRSRVIGRLFQDPLRGTAANMTIEENLALAYTSGRIGPFHFPLNKKNRDLFRERLSSFGMGLEDRMTVKVGTLSGGQRQALALLMTTIVVPDVLLLDEHTAALDPVSAETVMRLTNDIVRENKLTTLMITHNLESALHVGNRTIMMDSGKIILDIAGKEREGMTQEDIMQHYKNANIMLADRMLLTR